ncbi:hypothetical protein BJV74DRAFT_889878 [Russula compacta]|nr:hypothetical protein BJV74DRAFT_889878 [Russula compacta]
MYDHSPIDIATNPTSDAEAFLRQGSPFLDDAWINSRPYGILAYAHDHQVNTKSTLVQHIDEGAGASHPESLMTSTHENEHCIVRPSDTIDWATFFCLPLSTLGGSEVFVPAPVVSNEAPTPMYPANVDTTRNQGQEGVLMNVPPDRGPYTYVDTTAYSSGLSSLSGISRTPDLVQHHEQRASQPEPQKFKKTEKQLALASSRTSRRLAGAPKGPYSCSIQGCSKEYARPGGLGRHYREKHAPNLCMHCGVFKWGRPYLLREHIEKKHPDVDLDAALDKATGTSSRIITGHPQQQWVSPSAPEHDQWGCAESQPYPLTLPPISPPPMRPATCGVRSVFRARRANNKKEG